MGDNIETGVIIGAVASLFIFFFLIMGADVKTPHFWCDDIAQASKTEPYKIVYDRCMAEYQARKNNP